jgi:hypothetical protein
MHSGKSFTCIVLKGLKRTYVVLCCATYLGTTFGILKLPRLGVKVCLGAAFSSYLGRLNIEKYVLVG